MIMMSPETWLVKVKSAITHGIDAVSHIPLLGHPKTRSSLGILSLEVSGLITKLLHLWQSLSDKNIVRLKNNSVSLEGVRKIVSNDESFLLGLACAEMVENLRHLASAVCRLSKNCEDVNLCRFERDFIEFANSGQDFNGWVLSCKEMEARNRKMDRYATVTMTLRKEIEELSSLENTLKKLLSTSQLSSSHCTESESRQSHHYLKDKNNSVKEQRISDLQNKIVWQKQEVKRLKPRSLWNKSFDYVVSMLARSVFNVLARIKSVFGLGNYRNGLLTTAYPACLPRSLSASAAVHPSCTNYDHRLQQQSPNLFVSGSLKKGEKDEKISGFLELYSKMLEPPETTLGASALALHYANLVIVMENIIKSPQLVGAEARDDLYAMLPNSIRSSLRARLKGVNFRTSDQALAGEWRDALGRILSWLSPLAHNMIKWQSERSFEQKNLVAKTNVLLLQTLTFANKDKTEAAITELLVGLNYVWRFEREMTALALFDYMPNF